MSHKLVRMKRQQVQKTNYIFTEIHKANTNTLNLPWKLHKCRQFMVNDNDKQRARSLAKCKQSVCTICICVQYYIVTAMISNNNNSNYLWTACDYVFSCIAISVHTACTTVAIHLDYWFLYYCVCARVWTRSGSEFREEEEKNTDTHTHTKRAMSKALFDWIMTQVRQFSYRVAQIKRN